MQPDSHDHYGSVSRFLHWAWRLLLRWCFWWGSP